MKIIVADGGSTIVNVSQISRITMGENGGITYELVGKDSSNSCGGCKICRGNRLHSQVVFDELIEFISSEGNGVYNADKRMHDLQMVGIN